MADVSILYQLQCLDGEGDKKRHRLAQIEDALGESEALRQARKKVTSAQARVQKLTLQQRDRELEIQGLADKTAQEEQRLYSGVLRNPKELADLQAEVASLKRRRETLEEGLLEVMIERDDAEAIYLQAQQSLEEMQADWSADQADLLSEQEVLQGRLAELEQARGALLPSIDAGELTTYQDLRRRKGGLAVVQVSGGACGGCGVTVPPNLEWHLRQGELVTCGNCERILVRT